MDTNSIQAKAQEIILLEEQRLKADKVFDDLTGLYGDIRVELSKKAPDKENLIDMYAELMAMEQLICSPEAAYQMGREAALSKQEYKPMAYISEVFLAHDNVSFLKERDDLFQEICGLLDDTHSLMDDYNEAYRLCNGAINRKIHLFYDWGFYGKTPDLQETAG